MTSTQIKARDPFILVANIFIVLFGLWTIYCNLFVYMGGSFRLLVDFSFVPILAALAFVPMLIKPKRGSLSSSEEPSSPNRPRVPAAFLIIIAALIVLVYFLWGNFFLFWTLAVVMLCALYFGGSAVTLPQSVDKVIPGKAENRIVVILSVVAAVLTLISHRPDLDDSIYVNMIVTSLDYPEEALLSRDGLHGIQGLPFAYMVFRIHSFELLNALLIKLSGLPVLAVYHILLPALFAMLVIVSHWILLRKLSPSVALLSLFFSFLVMVAWGDVHRSPGNFCLVRLFQGKAVFVSAVVPLIIFYALEFNKQKDAKNWLLLCLSQVAAIGFSSSAVFTAPVAAGLVLLGGWRGDKTSTSTLLIGGCASFYIVVSGIILLFESTGTGGMSSTHPIFNGVEMDLKAVLGTGARRYIALFGILACPIIIPNITTRRVLSGFILLFFLLFLNPWASVVIYDLFTRFGSVILTWRFLWILPMPLLIGLAIGSLNVTFSRLGKVPVGLICFLLISLVFVFCPEPWTISRKNGTDLDFPRYKVPDYYTVAKNITTRTPARSRILAPEHISGWVTTLRGHPYPEIARTTYINALSPYLELKDLNARINLLRFISGERGFGKMLPVVIETLKERKILTVAFHSSLPWRHSFASELDRLGFKGQTVNKHEVWVKEPCSD